MIRINYVQEARETYKRHRDDNTLTDEQAYEKIAWDLYALIEEMQVWLEDAWDEIEDRHRMESEGT